MTDTHTYKQLQEYAWLTTIQALTTQLHTLLGALHIQLPPTTLPHIETAQTQLRNTQRTLQGLHDDAEERKQTITGELLKKASRSNIVPVPYNENL